MYRCQMVLFAVAALIISSYANASSIVNLRIGQKKFLTLPDYAESVKIETADVVDVNRGETKKVLVIVGENSGKTKVTVRLHSGNVLDYNVTVGKAGATTARLKALEAKINDINGLSASIKDGRVLVTGRINTRGDANILAKLKSKSGGLIIDGTAKEIFETSTVVRTINRVLRENDIANIQAHSYGSILVLEGSAKDEAQKNLAMRIARIIAPSIEDGISAKSNGAPSISIEVMFVEIQRTNNREIGMGGVTDVFSGNKPPSDVPTGAGVRVHPRKWNERVGRYNLTWQVGPLNAFLKLIQTKSASRVLSNPKLIARSGEDAKFHSGSTFYIGNKILKNGEVLEQLSPVDTGIVLEILPRLDAIGAIDAKIKTSISDVGDETVHGKPSISKSEVETAVTIKNGQSIMLSGLTRKSKSKTVSRVPLLASIPVIGEFFKSRTTKVRETELLVVVTMKRIQATDEKFDEPARLYDSAKSDVNFSFFE